MPFDPSKLTVKKATAKLSGLSMDELKALYEAELIGKHRSSLLSSIGIAQDALLEAAPVVEEAAVVVPEPPVAEIGSESFMRMHYTERRKWRSVGGGRFVAVG
tara:strand:- start:1639 stop:1947 length:309 start_codon:yes stop_codon:yes gene_type:complete